jgi:hypothetical protein
MPRTDSLVRENAALLEQARALLEKLSDDAYAAPEPELGSESIGAHVRHCAEFYARLLRGAPSGRIDFDARPRDARIERSRALGMRSLRVLGRALERLAQRAPGTPLWVRLDRTPGDPEWLRSSLGRELRALHAHTVHHLAAIRMILCLRGEEVPPDLGVAPATLRYRERSPLLERVR